jgi:predicted enzyme related to lactoylglutathione lyase
MFARYDLRTTDPDAARRFYSDVVGLDFGADEAPGLAVWELHEQARARGAPPHWLGAVAVDDIETTLRRLVEAGSERLGATYVANDGATSANVRDPSGAVVAVRQSARPSRRAPVAWHQLHTRDADAAWALYAGLLGWRRTGSFDAPDVVGGHSMFAWAEESPNVGSMANTARWPGVHPHWLFYFQVPDLDAALVRARASGARPASRPFVLPNRARLVPCADPQGAAFGLYEVKPGEAVVERVG